MKESKRIWRRMFHNVNCHICDEDPRWGNRCCLDCEYLEECVQKWRKGEHPFICHYAPIINGKQQEKWCSFVLDVWKREHR